MADRQTTTAVIDTTDEDVRPAPLVRSAGAGIGFGLSASNWDEGMRIARTLAASSLVPKGYMGKPEDVVVAMQYGAEVGLPPMAALQSIAVINGKPGLYGDGFLGVIMAAPAYLKHQEYYRIANGEVVQALTAAHLMDDLTTAVACFWRHGQREPFVAEFSIADAKRAKLWGKEGPWTQFPARQMRWRARGFAGRDGFAAELRGLTLSTELQDIDVEALAPAPVLVAPLRRSEKPSEPAVAADPAPAVKTAATPAPKTPTPSKPTPATTPSGAPSASVLEPVVITQTEFATPPAPDTPYYEIRATVTAEGESPVGYVFRTADKDLYELAASAEGSPQLFKLTWHVGRRPDGSPCKILDAIAAS